jgi:hypothetical protein
MRQRPIWLSARPSPAWALSMAKSMAPSIEPQKVALMLPLPAVGAPNHSRLGTLLDGRRAPVSTLVPRYAASVAFFVTSLSPGPAPAGLSFPSRCYHRPCPSGRLKSQRRIRLRRKVALAYRTAREAGKSHGAIDRQSGSQTFPIPECGPLGRCYQFRYRGC